MVVVAGNCDHRNLQGANGRACGRHGGLGDMGRVEKVASHDHKSGTGFLDSGRQLAYGLDPLFLQAEALRVIADGGEGFTQLPVSSV